MTNEELVNNEIIADFVGYTIEGDYITMPDMLEALLIEDLKYHNSWDDLMPVVEKIESLDHTWHEEIKSTFYVDGFMIGQENSKSVSVHLTVFNADKITEIKLCDLSYGVKYFKKSFFKTKIKAVYAAVIEFIKWYNKMEQDGKQL